MWGCHGGNRGGVGRTGLGGAGQAPHGAATVRAGLPAGGRAVSFSVNVTGMTGSRVEADERVLGHRDVGSIPDTGGGDLTVLSTSDHCVQG